jgi:BirA family biotin operon repressor/biotin-[acetyl-CoA-carboxylase] ligase
MGNGAPRLPDGVRLEALQSVDSTNAEALRRASGGEQGPLWIIADHQTSGRGRSGRTWSTGDGNLAGTLLMMLPRERAAVSYQLALLAGVAVFDALESSGAVPEAAGLRLKWPNDILIDGRKLGGILIESTPVGGRLAIAVGIGLNLHSHPFDTALPAASLAEFGTPPSRCDLIGLLSHAVADWLARWQEGDGFGEIRAAWLERAGPTGEKCSVTAGEQRVEGRFSGLDADGALLILTADGRQQRYTYGDVSLTR